MCELLHGSFDFDLLAGALGSAELVHAIKLRHMHRPAPAAPNLSDRAARRAEKAKSRLEKQHLRYQDN
jgi:hypothetical protein